ncbi:MAG: hypothetical protein ACFE0Q_01150 [Anaerolineae bacterium]
MVTQSSVTPDTEPTPEFDARCMALVNGWQQGDTPSKGVVHQLKALARTAARDGHIANEARAEHLSGYIQHYVGNLTVSILHYDKARQLFDRVGNQRRVTVMDINQGENYRYMGQFKRARRLYRAAYEAASTLGDVRLQTIAIANEGLMLVSLQHYEQAEKALRRGLELSGHWQESQNLQGLLTEVHFGLAQVALATEAPDTAWQHAQLSLYNARIGKNMHSIGLAYRILGDALTALQDVPDDSEHQTPDDYYRAALNSFREIDAEAEIGRTIYSHASSYARRNRRRHAAQLFREAMVIFTRLGMTDDVASAAEAQLRVM